MLTIMIIVMPMPVHPSLNDSHGVYLLCILARLEVRGGHAVGYVGSFLFLLGRFSNHATSNSNNEYLWNPIYCWTGNT
jgi:hypothetical protein